jgi:urea transport system permease protein
VYLVGKSLADIPIRLFAGGVGVVLLLGLFLSPVAWAADEPEAPAATHASTASPLEAALLDLQSEDAAVRSRAAEVLIAQGDATLLPRLDAMREEGSRAVRIALKPVIDLLKNRANLTSESPMPGGRRRPIWPWGGAEAIPDLKAAAAQEEVWWVRYTMEEAQHFLELQPRIRPSSWTR